MAGANFGETRSVWAPFDGAGLDLDLTAVFAQSGFSQAGDQSRCCPSAGLQSTRSEIVEIAIRPRFAE